MSRNSEIEHWNRASAESRARSAARAKRARKRKQQVYLARFVAFWIVLILFGGGFFLTRYVVRRVTGDENAMETVLDDRAAWLFQKKVKRVYEQPDFVTNLLPVNEYSRPAEELPEVKNIFVHYTANAGTTAEQNRSYFANLAQTGETSASAHFIIGYEGEIIECIPLSEIAYAVKGRNYDSISIECCYLEEDGRFTDETYQSLLRLLAWLLGTYQLEPEDVMRHYDEGGKNCPKYYVEHEDAWKTLIQDLRAYIEENGTYDEP
jgi:hypothetical protein